jgi:hypothetical protein
MVGARGTKDALCKKDVDHMDFDPRDHDSRDDDLVVIERHRDSGSGYDTRDDDWNLGDTRTRDDDGDVRGIGGRGPGDDSRESNGDHRDPRDDARWPERDRDVGDRSADPRGVFTRKLSLPRGHQRELVRDRDREYTLRGSESRTLATVGAFRVVSSRDLRDHDGRPTDPRTGDLRHLREHGLIRTERIDGHRDVAVVLTKDGRSLLESHRREHSHDHAHDAREDRQQAFYAELKKPREVEHDSQIFRAYLREAERLAERGDRVDRVALDYELKRDYQRWLHERDKDRETADGRPDRDAGEIEEWAREHDLPYFDDQVHFPDVRIEYETPDGRLDHVDVEVTTLHYRGAHGAAAARSGFSSYGGVSVRLGGSGSRGGGRSGAGLAEELWD